MKIVYHGSFVSVPEPLTNVGRCELDFGPGFYVTTIREQAEEIGRLKARIDMLERRPDAAPIG